MIEQTTIGIKNTKELATLATLRYNLAFFLLVSIT